jgi:hypothetical protein
MPWQLRFGMMPPHPASFLRKEVYNNIGPYKLNYKIAADFDMFVRLFLKKRYTYTKLDKTIVRMRNGGVSTSGLKSHLLSTKEMLVSLRENMVYSNYFFVLFRFFYKVFQCINVK